LERCREGDNNSSTGDKENAALLGHFCCRFVDFPRVAGWRDENALANQHWASPSMRRPVAYNWAIMDVDWSIVCSLLYVLDMGESALAIIALFYVS
jgi:hypothetical protein